MSQEFDRRYSYSGGLVDSALRDRWWPFQNLRSEFNAFQPQSIESFEEDRPYLFESIRRDDESASDEEVMKQVDACIRRNAEPKYQREMAFHGRILPEYVNVAILSHALCESIINAVIAEGLAKAKTPELFSILDRAKFEEKWYAAPKAFHPSYEFAQGTALSETLNRLTEQRNNIVHLKHGVVIDGVAVGKALNKPPLRLGTGESHLEWMHRYFSLPFDLIEMVRVQIPGAWTGSYTRAPMKPAPAHWQGPPLKGLK